MSKKLNYDYIILFLITLIIASFSYLMRIVYPYEVLDWDTYSWYQHAKEFKFFSHSSMENCRTLPFGLLLLFARDYLHSNYFIFFVNNILLILSLFSYYALTESFLNSKLLRIVAVLLLLFFVLLSQKLIYYNNVLLPEASCSYLFFLGANLSLIGFFKKNKKLLISGYTILGIGAFYKANTFLLIPIWLAFLIYIKRYFSFKVLILCFLLLTSPVALYQIRALIIGGNQGFPASYYLLARALPLLQKGDLISENADLNKKIYEMYINYISTNELYKISPFDSLLNLYEYKSIDNTRWSDLIIEASGIEKTNDSELLYEKSTLIIANRIIQKHFIQFVRLVLKRYIETLNPFNECEICIAEDSRDRYSNFNSIVNVSSDFKNIFFSERYKFEVPPETMKIALFLKSGCRLAQKLDFKILILIAHFFLLYALFVVVNYKQKVNSFVILSKAMIVYLCYFLTVLPQHFMTSVMNIVKFKHAVPFELLIFSSLIIMFISIIALIVKNLMGSRY